MRKEWGQQGRETELATREGLVGPPCCDREILTGHSVIPWPGRRVTGVSSRQERYITGGPSVCWDGPGSVSCRIASVCCLVPPPLSFSLCRRRWVILNRRKVPLRAAGQSTRLVSPNMKAMLPRSSRYASAPGLFSRLAERSSGQVRGCGPDVTLEEAGWKVTCKFP